MKENKSFRGAVDLLQRLVIILGLLFGLAVPAQSGGQTGSNKKAGAAKRVARRPTETEREALAKMPGSIKVHGHWTIEVRKPDGTLAARREFENALTAGTSSTGDVALAQILSRATTPGSWFIRLSAATSTFGPCLQPSLTLTRYCEIVDTTISDPVDTSFEFKTLTVDVPPSGVNAGKLVLSGTATATAPNPGPIELVQTLMLTCSPGSSPSRPCSNSAGSALYVLTRTTLASPVPLSTGQAIQVTVVISFS